MARLRGLGIFVGTGECNARCNHCAGLPLRRYAPRQDGIIDEPRIRKTLVECYENGARSLSLTSSGEPTLSPIAVTKTLGLAHDCEREGMKYSPISIYSNGIRIGQDREFCEEYLPMWRNYGLTTVYITVHDLDETRNAAVYRVPSYPLLEEVISRIHGADLLMRANLVLSRNGIGTYEGFCATVSGLRERGADMVSAWPIRDMDDKVDAELSPLEEELDKMDGWVKTEPFPGFKIRLLREDSRVQYTSGQKLTLFPDGMLSGSWCNR